MLIRIYHRLTPQHRTAKRSVLARSSIAVQRRRLTALLADARGAVLVEYTILIGTLALAGIIGLIAVGIAVLNSFSFVRGLLLGAAP